MLLKKSFVVCVFSDYKKAMHIHCRKFEKRDKCKKQIRPLLISPFRQIDLSLTPSVMGKKESRLGA